MSHIPSVAGVAVADPGLGMSREGEEPRNIAIEFHPFSASIVLSMPSKGI